MSPYTDALEEDITWNWFDVCIVDREKLVGVVSVGVLVVRCNFDG